MHVSKLLTMTLAGLILSTGAVTVASAPASALGAGGWTCATGYSSSGFSSRTGSNTTSSPPQCGNAKIQVLYSVTGGSAIRTPWRTSPNIATQPAVGYSVMQGYHHVTKAAPAYNHVNVT